MAVAIQHRFSLDDYLAIQQASGWRTPIELVAGEAVVMAPTGGDASSMQGELHVALRLWQNTVEEPGLLLQDVFVRMPGDTVLAPDIAWWAERRRPVVGPGAMDAVPDLVVEVLSPATRENDLGAKRAAYLAAGVTELWLADPAAGTVTVVGVGERTLRPGDRLASDLLPGFAVDVASLRLDRD
jgi:Uma2 family endonuclease